MSIQIFLLDWLQLENQEMSKNSALSTVIGVTVGDWREFCYVWLEINSVLRSQVFGQALMESCGFQLSEYC